MARWQTCMIFQIEFLYLKFSIVVFFQVVFGEVVDGMDLVKKIEGLGSQSGTPKAKITIAKSGTV